MTLAPGTRLGVYEVTAPLGAGGMGEVYRAADSNLKRSVAIKVLPASVAGDADRLARFQREAEVLAALNHPNIGAIYGLEKTPDFTALVMELVEGDDLSQRIARGAIPIDEALPIAKQIADALEAAHEQGIIHRDLKPANIKIRQDGTVKVLDFGLAKAMEPAAGSASSMSMSPTLTTPAMTQMGMILGTAAYMSPEQAKGRAVDKRSDVWAFGAVLYEMLSGKRAFAGEDVSETLADVMRVEPTWANLPDGLSPSLRTFLKRCLQKDARQRLGDMHDMRLALEGAFDAEPAATTAPAATVPRPLWRRALPAITSALVVGALAGAAGREWRPAPPQTVTRFSVTLAEGQRFTNLGRMVVAISPDGAQMVYAANQRLYHRAMSDLEARPIPGTENWQGVVNPVFSPDGRSLVFWAVSDRTFKKIAVTGGASVTLCAAAAPFGMNWSEEGIVFGQGNAGIMKVSENGGKPELLVHVENGELAHGPQLLPGGEAVLYTVSMGAAPDQWDKARVFVQSLKPGSARKLLIDGGADARYVATGHIVYAFGGSLFAVPFDLGRLTVTGGQVPVVEGVSRAFGITGSAQFSTSSTGSLIYVPGPVSVSGATDRSLATLDSKGGGLERLKLAARPYAFPRVSPDGKRVAVSTDDAKDTNVWIVDLSGATAPRQLTLGGANRYPVWSADGERVAFQSDREGDSGLFWQKADGTGTAERLTKPEQGIVHIPDSWSSDGTRLSYTAVKGPEGAVWIYSIQDRKATVFAEKAGSLIGRSAFSPDGQWLAYQSNETGTNQIFVQPFPGTGAKYPVVTGGHPFWSPDGRELFYNPAAGQIGVVGITTRPAFAFGEATRLPGGTSGLLSRNPATDPRVWDITRDGKKLMGVTDAANADTVSSGTPAAPQIRVVLNWFTELQQRVPTR